MKKIFFLFILFFPFLAFAQAETTLMDYLSQIHSMKANFTQSIRDARGRTLDHSTGNMALQRPGQFRWATQQPQQQLVIANQAIVWIYDEDLAQATKQKQQNDNRLSPALLLSTSDKHLLDNFTITKTPDDHFLLTPKKSSDALFTRLILVFKQRQLQSMKMEDKLGQITLIYFSQIQLNPTLPATLFQFTPPPGVDVVDNT